MSYSLNDEIWFIVEAYNKGEINCEKALKLILEALDLEDYLQDEDSG